MVILVRRVRWDEYIAGKKKIEAVHFRTSSR